MSDPNDTNSKLQIVESQEYTEIKEEEPGTSGMSGDRPQKRAGRRPGRRSSKMDVRAKLERSRQSARECRARKKLRYQYLEDLVVNREKAVFALRDELEMYKQWCIQIDSGLMPMALLQIGENATRDEVQPKRIRLEKVTEGSKEVAVVAATPKSHDRMDTQSDGSDQTNREAKSFRASNSEVKVFIKGGKPMLKTLCKEVDDGQPSEQLKEKLFRDCDLEKSELDD